MTIQSRAIFIVILINLFIILFSVISGIGYTRQKIDQYIEADMTVVANIADQYISAEINLLKLKSIDVIHNLVNTEQANWSGILAEKAAPYPEFIGVTVYTPDGELLVSAGEKPATVDVLDDKYIRQAFEGKESISSVCGYGDDIVFYLGMPIPGAGKRILLVTLPGMFFSDLVSDFKIWETGHVYMIDAEAYMVSNPRAYWIHERFNSLEAALTDSQFQELADVNRRMIQGESSVARFSVHSVSSNDHVPIPRISAFRPVSGSREGWSLGVSAPLPESPARDIDEGLMLVGMIGLFLSAMAAIIASYFIKKPFEEIAALKEIAEENSKTKSRFLANMSHEMRTPLNAVIGLSELTLCGEIQGEEKENIHKVYTAGVTLLGIINDILDISKIESGKFELNPIVYDVPSLINDAVTLNIMRIEDKPVTFKLFVDESLPSKLCGDDLRIKQIFNNLLSNAFKYTRAGIVEWHILWEKNDKDIWLISSIKDSGIGIRQEDIPKLFENYTQLDTSANRQIEGTGLGLPLTKYLTEMMDGKIIVDSEYGKGSTFTIRIRQGFVSNKTIGKDVADNLKNFKYTVEKHQRHSRLVHLQLPYARILVVDDVPTNLAVVRGIMKPYNMQIDCVTSGIEAIERIQQGEKYDAIFMDHMMPDMNGMEATRIIRNEIDNEYAKTVPIIALTANVIRGNEELFLNSGFQAFLSKPIDINQMDAVIRHWVRNKDKEQGIGQGNQGEDANNELVQKQSISNYEIKGIELKKALVQFNGDEETLLTVLQFYTEQTPPMLDTIRVIPEKLLDYVTIVHGLKGSSKGICATKVGDLAEKLEEAGKAGNYTFIRNNNETFINEVEILIDAIKEWLEEIKD